MRVSSSRLEAALKSPGRRLPRTARGGLLLASGCRSRPPRASAGVRVAPPFCRAQSAYSRVGSCHSSTQPCAPDTGCQLTTPLCLATGGASVRPAASVPWGCGRCVKGLGGTKPNVLLVRGVSLTPSRLLVHSACSTRPAVQAVFYVSAGRGATRFVHSWEDSTRTSRVTPSPFPPGHPRCGLIRPLLCSVRFNPPSSAAPRLVTPFLRPRPRAPIVRGCVVRVLAYVKGLGGTRPTVPVVLPSLSCPRP